SSSCHSGAPQVSTGLVDPSALRLSLESSTIVRISPRHLTPSTVRQTSMLRSLSLAPCPDPRIHTSTESTAWPVRRYAAMLKPRSVVTSQSCVVPEYCAASPSLARLAAGFVQPFPEAEANERRIQFVPLCSPGTVTRRIRVP